MEFKTVVSKLYPGAREDNTINTFEKLERLTKRWQSKGVQSLEDLGSFYHEALPIATKLAEANELGNSE